MKPALYRLPRCRATFNPPRLKLQQWKARSILKHRQPLLFWSLGNDSWKVFVAIRLGNERLSRLLNDLVRASELRIYVSVLSMSCVCKIYWRSHIYPVVLYPAPDCALDLVERLEVGVPGILSSHT